MKIPFTKYAIKRFNPQLENQYKNCAIATKDMQYRSHARYHIINTLLNLTEKGRYLEIGMRNPSDCFARIEATYKISVDPGIEVEVNQADYKMTSDEFFGKLFANDLQIEQREFDVIFLDGLHLADQVYRDIQNSLKIIADVGYIVMHDCNPPTIFHARETFSEQGPATHFWNGTTWKAFQRFRTESNKRCYVVDVDWGVGVIVNHDEEEENRLDPDINPFYEYRILDQKREQILNLSLVSDIPELKNLL